MKQNKIEGAIFKMLGHPERKRILQIIAKTDGIHYSGILTETGLATNKLNYQLKEMEGFIKKEEGLYSLSPLGEKTIDVLDYMNDNIDSDSLDSELFEIDERSKYVTKSVDGFFKVVIGSFLVGPIISAYLFFSQPGGLPLWALGFITVTCCGFMILFNRMRLSSPVYMLSFVDWLDWKFFNGNGVVDFRGQKVFVMAVLGLFVGVLFGEGVLGLIVGSFLGSAMEL